MLKDDFLQTFDDTACPRALTDSYELLECLGAKEQRETFLAQSKASGQKCVIKCYMGEEKSAGYHEAALLQRLSHPAIVQYLGCIETPSMLCVIREYAAGPTLEERYRKSPPTAQETAAIGILLCDALSYLHSQTPPVIHRDIKPQNIVLREDSGIALIDFDISRSYREGEETDTHIIGTKQFAAPEQYGFAQTDGRSDLFSLGIVLNYLLTGGTKPDEKTLPDGALKKAILGCTRFAPEDRLQTPAEVRAILSDTAPKPQRTRTGQRLTRLTATPARRIIAALLLIAALSAALAGRSSGFREPLIEQAALLSLGRQGGRLTAEDCLSVTSLYIMGDSCMADADAFYNGAYDWGMSGSVHSGITDLSDLKRFPNLMAAGIYGAHISDLTPLTGLTKLSSIALGENDITDCSPLAGVPSLRYVHLFHNPLLDASPLAELPNLYSLELGLCDGYDPAFLADISSLDCLGIGNATNSYEYLDGMRIRELWLCYSDISDLSALAGVSGLEYLILSNTPLASLDGIETHTRLKTLEIANTGITDLTPLLSLPALETVVISEDMLPCAEVAAQEARFKITVW